MCLSKHWVHPKSTGELSCFPVFVIGVGHAPFQTNAYGNSCLCIDWWFFPRFWTIRGFRVGQFGSGATKWHDARQNWVLHLMWHKMGMNPRHKSSCLRIRYQHTKKNGFPFSNFWAVGSMNRAIPGWSLNILFYECDDRVYVWGNSQ